MSHRLSFSRMALAHACSWSFREDVAAVERPSGRAARIGSAVHSMVECAVKGSAVALAEDDDIVAEAKTIFDGPLSGFVASHEWTACELGLRLDADADACTIGPRRGEAGYGEVPAMVLPGTLDLVLVDGDKARIYDVKTGKMPEDNEQLYAQAVAVSRLYGVSKVEVAYARALKTKLQTDGVEVLDADRLDQEAGRIARVLRKLPTSQPVPGEAWCWKCSARGACPAFGAEAADAKMRSLEEAGLWA
jgi:hypothetical protein